MAKKKPRRKTTRKATRPPLNPSRRVSRAEWRKRYAAYMRSPEWKNLRERIFTERGRACERCGGEEKLSLHHLSYARVGNEDDADLMILCFRCHCRAHSRKLFFRRKNRRRKRKGKASPS